MNKENTDFNNLKNSIIQSSCLPNRLFWKTPEFPLNLSSLHLTILFTKMWMIAFHWTSSVTKLKGACQKKKIVGKHVHCSTFCSVLFSLSFCSGLPVLWLTQSIIPPTWILYSTVGHHANCSPLLKCKRILVLSEKSGHEGPMFWYSKPIIK